MYSKNILKRFASPEYAGAFRGANGTGKAGHEECGDVIRIYLLVNEDGEIEKARFKAYGGVCTIAISDVACELIEGEDLENALTVDSNALLEELGDLPENRTYTAFLAEEAIKNAVEDYYKKREKALKE